MSDTMRRVAAIRNGEPVQMYGAGHVRSAGSSYERPPKQHGTRGCYIDGCRCPECREATNAARRRSRAAKKR